MSALSTPTVEAWYVVQTNQTNQRQELRARALGISLGKANFWLNALIEKAVVKANSFLNSCNQRAYAYVFPPSGIEEKARVTLRFLKGKVGEYEALQMEIAELTEQARKLRVGGIQDESELAAVIGPESDARVMHSAIGSDRKPS